MGIDTSNVASILDEGVGDQITISDNVGPYTFHFPLEVIGESKYYLRNIAFEKNRMAIMDHTTVMNYTYNLNFNSRSDRLFKADDPKDIIEGLKW